MVVEDDISRAGTSAAYWDGIAPWYARAYRDSWSLREDRAVSDLILEWLEPQDADVILDVGCGQGLGANLLQSSSYRLIGIDISMEMLSRFECDSHRQVLRADMHRLPFRNDCFNGVVSIFGCLSYADDLDIVLSEIDRVMKPNSRFLIMLLSRFALDRVLRLQIASHGMYGSQGAPGPGVEAQFYSRSVKHAFNAHRLKVHQILGIAPWRLNGRGELLAWHLGRSLCQVFPEAGHALVILGSNKC